MDVLHDISLMKWLMHVGGGKLAALHTPLIDLYPTEVFKYLGLIFFIPAIRGDLRMNSRLQAGLLALMLAANPCPALADDPDTVSGDKGTDMLVDAVVMRPLGLAATVLGAVITVVTLPFTLPTGSADEAARYMIVEPAEYTFNRPLGDFDSCGEDRHPCGASGR
jgi:hypothetical protein